MFSKAERICMILILGEYFQNCLLASRMYVEIFPDGSRFNKSVFQRLLAQFKQTGSLAHGKPFGTKFEILSKKYFT